MTDAVDPSLLSTLVGGRGIYIEKGLFHYGELKSYEFGENGYLELHLTLDTRPPLVLGSDSISLRGGAIQASGYVSWAWIYDAQTIANIEKLIAERADEVERRDVHRYQLACCVLDPGYERMNMRPRKGSETEA